MKILLADDDEYNLIVATDTLKLKAGVTVTIATNGKEVIALLQENDFDVILMDVQMPEMDGLEATRYIRNNFSSPKRNIPILALTASTLKDDLDKCTDAGMNAFIPKPFSTQQLMKGIEDAIRTKENNASSGAQQEINHKGPTSLTDLTYLRNFCECDASRMRKYITLFLESIPLLSGNINSALTRDNYTQIANQVHGYKTKLVMMGMQQTKALASEIEQQCRQEAIGIEVKDDISLFMQQIRVAETELKTALLHLK